MSGKPSCIPAFLVLLIALSVISTGCVRIHTQQTTPIRTRTNIGVFLANYKASAIESYNHPKVTLSQIHLYESFWKKGFNIIALNDLDVSSLLSEFIALKSIDAANETAKESNQFDNTVLLSSLQQHLRRMKIDYLFIVSLRSSNTRDFKLKMEIIETDTMKVVAYKNHSDNTLAVACSITSIFLGVPMLICPWFAIYDDEAREIAILTGALDGFNFVDSLGPKEPSAPAVKNTPVETKEEPVPTAEAPKTNTVPGVPPYTTSDVSESNEALATKLTNDAMERYNNKDWAGAARLFIEALKSNPGAVDPRYNLAGVYSLMGDAGSAITLLQQLKDAGCERCLKLLERTKTNKDFDSIRDKPRFWMVVGP